VPNAYFQFKQFTVQQDQCAMKVCTDACILGAYAKVERAASVLDIGTGTGLLALMAAQRSQATIDAVEIELNMYRQATQNIQQSPFASRIRIFHQPIQVFSPEPNQLYDVIVSNPPFFRNHLRSTDASRNVALHAESLSFEELLQAVDRLLSPQGKFFVLLPCYEASVLEESAHGFGLFSTRQLFIRHSARHPVFRVIHTFTRVPEPAMEEELSIYQSINQYTIAFQSLLKAYYLAF
jgi:tRNA1Val (adenine37-N6)-methyltransferase